MKPLQLKNILFVLLALFLSLGLSAFAQGTNPSKSIISGKVIGISDGDTITILVQGHEQYTVRLAAIDCPEKTQSFGNRAKRVLSEKVFGHNVRIENRGKDQYGRSLGIVMMGDIDINEYMISQGLAWHYKKYADKQPPEEADRYSRAEEIAKQNKKGFWIQDNPTPPWQYRNENKINKTQ